MIFMTNVDADTISINTTLVYLVTDNSQHAQNENKSINFNFQLTCEHLRLLHISTQRTTCNEELKKMNPTR